MSILKGIITVIITVLVIIVWTIIEIKTSEFKVTSVNDLKDNVYESIILSNPDYSADEVVDEYLYNQDYYDSLGYDEVIIK